MGKELQRKTSLSPHVVFVKLCEATIQPEGEGESDGQHHTKQTK